MRHDKPLIDLTKENAPNIAHEISMLRGAIEDQTALLLGLTCRKESAK
jgi:hypothetical protein